MSPAASVLSVQNVTKRFGSFCAVDQVSFEIQRGSVCALLGANGAGKTTLLRMIIGLIPIDSGTISCPLAKNSRQDWFSYLPEECGIYEQMRVEDAILYFARLSGMDKNAAKEKMNYWLDRMKLAPKRRNRMVELSKGNQQKAKLISALINQPPLLILDEPFTGLDGDGSALLRDALDQARAEGITLLLSSHRLDQMDLLADHIVVISSGKKILDAALEDARKLYRQNQIQITFSVQPPSLEGLPGVLDLQWDEGVAILSIGPTANINEIIRVLLDRGCEIESFSRHLPNLSEIFHAATR